MAWLSSARREVGVRPTLALPLLLLFLGCSSVVSPDPDRLGSGSGDASTGDGSTSSDATIGRDGAVGRDGGTMPADGGGVPDATTGSGLGNPSACGPSETRCRVDQVCAGDACVCRPGLTAAGDACVDLMSDPNNCGMVGVSCGGGVCARGHCTDSCGDGLRYCDGACVGFNDVLNCGECGHACNRDEVCVRGRCRQYDPLPCNSCPCTRCENTCCAYGVGTICLETEACP